MIFLSSASACQKPGDGIAGGGSVQQTVITVTNHALSFENGRVVLRHMPGGLASLGMGSALLWRAWQSLLLAHSCSRTPLQSLPQLTAATSDMSVFGKSHTERQGACTAPGAGSQPAIAGHT